MAKDKTPPKSVDEIQYVGPDSDHLQKANPRSLYNVLPKNIQAKMNQVPMALFHMDDQELEQEVLPTPTMRLLRTKLWTEFHRMVEESIPGKMQMSEVVKGVCSTQLLVEKAFSSHYATAWMIMPPRSYIDAMEESLAMGVLRLREILELPIQQHAKNREGTKILRDDQGKPITKIDVRVANLIVKVYALLDQRIKGGFTQRHELKATQITGSLKDVKEIKDGLTMEETQRRLAELKKLDGAVEIPLKDVSSTGVKDEF